MNFDQLYEYVVTQLTANEFAIAGVMTSAFMGAMYWLRVIPVRL
jgi:hypothetical protein